MNIRITKPIRGGMVRATASKSEAHRLLICAALADRETFIECSARSEDIDATARCLEALGAVVRHESDGFFVTPVSLSASGQNPKQNEKANLDCGESGSTLRFLLPVCGALGLRASFHMAGRLPARPLSALYDEMAAHGCSLSEPGGSPLTCDGQLKSGTYTLPGNVSSQYVSGLLFALPLLSGDSIIRVTGVLESRPYVDMTLDALRLFGISVPEEEKQVFLIPDGQTVHSPGGVRVEGDWSNAAFWLSAGAIGESGVTCTGLSLDSRQGDRAIAGLLARYGANVAYGDDSVTVSPGTLRGVEIDAGNIPDLVPVLAAVASAAEGKTIIRNAGRLRIKESDRLSTVAASLSSLGADIEETEDGLVIAGKKGGKKLTGGETESFGDHRIAMTAAVLSSACGGPVTIRGAETVRKSYPRFFEDFKTALGGECEEMI
ncbi:MAG: 3-phosphoshikimate 1-carboxyvinyltransferase [Synergistaceae bacterium]|nr:3-phosphoshikimate 1-carboxyvinyltransferase [Synergistaceae bacterium]